MTEYEKLRAIMAAQLAGSWILAFWSDADKDDESIGEIVDDANASAIEQANDLLDALNISKERDAPVRHVPYKIRRGNPNE